MSLTSHFNEETSAIDVLVETTDLLPEEKGTSLMIFETVSLSLHSFRHFDTQQSHAGFDNACNRFGEHQTETF